MLKCLVAALCLSFGFLASGPTHPVQPTAQSLLPEASATITVDEPHPPKTGKFVPVIRFSGAITDDSSLALEQKIFAAEGEGASGLVIVIDSPGGIVEDGFRLAAAISSAIIPTHCVADEQAQSMAFFVLQSCTTRHMTKGTVLMTHEPKSIIQGVVSAEDLSVIAEALTKSNQLMTDFEARRMKIGADELRKRIDHQDWVIDEKEALQVGAIDSVVVLSEYVASVRR